MTKDLLSEHRRYIKNRNPIRKENLIPDMIVAFNYPRDKEKRKPRFVYVLNPDYDGKLHGLTISQIPREELLVLLPRLIILDDPQPAYTDYIKKIDSSYFGYRTYLWDDISNLELVDYKMPKDVAMGVISQLKKKYVNGNELIDQIEKSL